MFKKIINGLILIGILFAFSSCSNNITKDSKKVSVDKNTKSKLQVVVSFNAMREFAQAIGKDKVEITTVVPNGTEPHDFEPKARDIEELSNADVFVYNGLGMESWADKALQIIDNKKLIVVEASKGINTISSGVTNDSGSYDPHVWISLKGAETESKNIKNALVKADPSDKKYYEKNYTEFYNSLEKLFNEYNKKFINASSKNFVTGHAAFAYFCRDFGLKQNSVEGVFAEGEPSAVKLKELIDNCKINKIKTIFVEDMVSPRVSETLASEVGAKAVKIYTVESKEDNKNYLQTMEGNLERIYDSLK